MKLFRKWRIENLFLFSAMFLVSVLTLPGSACADISQTIEAGDQALAIKDYAAAEKAFAEAVAMEPDNFRTLKSLAEIKVALKKYAEADPLIDRLLAMEVTNGKKVVVTLEGEPEPLEAELVDETVVLKEVGENNMRNYLSPVSPDPVPHYRFFFFKEGVMELVPKHRATFKYAGIPRSAREEVLALQGEVKMHLIGASQSRGPVEMVPLKGGCFQMGSQNGHSDEQPVHEVCVSPFKMDKYETTQREFQMKMEINPSRFKGADLPVESVTWMEAAEFCKKSGKRLPTEAEWEYAMRGGTATEYHWGEEFDPAKGNFCDSSCALNVQEGTTVSDGFPFTAPVGSFPPNAFNLYDMAGNVNEWVQDWMEENYYRKSPKQDPKGPMRSGEILRGATNYKVFRGGSWENRPADLRSAHRKGIWVDYRIEGLGFRCAAD